MRSAAIRDLKRPSSRNGVVPRRQKSAVVLRVALVVAVVECLPRAAEASCDAIPSAARTFRSSVGQVSQPFAGPGDWVEITLDAACDSSSPGFGAAPAEQVVTVLFTPPAPGPRNAVVLATDCASIDPLLPACEAEGLSATCVEVNGQGAPTSLERRDQRTLRFRFPDTDPLLAAPADDLTFAGPAKIAVTDGGTALPCDLADAPCAPRPGLLACIDGLYARNGSCDATPDGAFSGFTALPPPNDYQAICTSPIPPCRGVEGDVRFAVDAAGNLLLPMDWRGVLVRENDLPVARQLRARSDVEAFLGRGVPLLLPEPAVLSSFSPRGVRILPVFDPLADPTDVQAATLFGTADAPQTVLRIARHEIQTSQCDGGPSDGLPCVVAGDCPGGTCGGATCFVGGMETATPCGTDGRFVAFNASHVAYTPPDDQRDFNGVFLLGPSDDPGNLAAHDRTGDGDVADTVLAALDVGPASPGGEGAIERLCPAASVSVAEGVAAFLRPESSGASPGLPLCPAGTPVVPPPSEPGTGGEDLNGDGDAGDHVVHFWPGAGPVQNLGRAATAVALSDQLVAALVSEKDAAGIDRNGDSDAEDDVVEVYRLATASWNLLGQAADALDAQGPHVAFLTPEGAQQTPLNGDGDQLDRVLQLFEASGGAGWLTNTGQAAEDFVVGKKGLIAFRTLEASQGEDLLDGDGPASTGVLQIYDAEAHELINTGQPVTPCRLEACDPRVPYLVLDDTVRFLTFEGDRGSCQGGDCTSCDLNGDGDCDDLVVQLLNVRHARQSGDLDVAQHPMAATVGGVCTNTGEPCAGSASCGAGTCFVPPGGCILDSGTVCDADPEQEPSGPSCPADEFCAPTPGGGGFGTCKKEQGITCQANADCVAPATCSEGDQDFQRLVGPLMAQDAGGAAFTGVGHCLEDFATPCTTNVDCTAGAFCDGGTCHRDHGLCASDGACPTGAECRQELIAATVSDGDQDEVPDFVDNCPDVANPAQEDADGDDVGDGCDAQTCGDGLRQVDEHCDDGNLTGADGCEANCTLSAIAAGCAPIESARLILSRLGGNPNDESVNLSGKISFGPGQPPGFDPLDATTRGAQILIEDLGNGSSSVYELSHRTRAVPPGPKAPVCSSSRKDGWKANPRLTTYTYTNASNALPTALCAAGSARGLRSLKLTDRRATPRPSIDFKARAAKASIAPPVGPLRATVVLSAVAAEGLSGACGQVAFDVCLSNASGTTMTCR